MKPDFEGLFLLSDFDMSLTGHDGEIPERNIAALERFTSAGGFFTVCTGRTLQGFHRYDLDVINAPVLLANGALCYDYSSGKQVFLDGVDESAHDLIRALAREFPTASIEMYPVGASYVIHPTEGSIVHFERQGIEYSVVDDPSQAVGVWQKAMVDAEDKSAQVQRFLEENQTVTDYIRTDGQFVEIVKKGVTKATGAFKLADYLGVKRENCYAVGDGDNDVDMLEKLKSFCPSGASELAKAAADTVVCSADDGAVADAVECLSR